MKTCDKFTNMLTIILMFLFVDCANKGWGLGDTWISNTADVLLNPQCTIDLDFNQQVKVYEDLLRIGAPQEDVGELHKLISGKLDNDALEETKDSVIDIIQEMKREKTSKHITVRSSKRRDCQRACKEALSDACAHYNCRRIRSRFRRNCRDKCRAYFC